MESKKKSFPLSVPSAIQSIGQGFNFTAQQLFLVLPPILLDIFFWFGAKLRAYDLMNVAFTRLAPDVLNGLSEAQSVAYQDMLNQSVAILAQTNLFGLLQTLPIGIPALLSALPIGQSPLGIPAVYEVSSFGLLLIYLALFTIAGVVLGSIYFTAIGWRTVKPLHSGYVCFAKTVLNVMILCVAIFGLLLILAVPFSCVLTLFMLFSPGITQVITFLMLLGVAWLIVPLFFVPHAIAVDNLSLSEAIKQSVALARRLSAPTSFFIVVAVILWQGLNMIWLIPAADSWFLLIGIIGNALMTTVLTAAGFVLYRKNCSFLEKLDEEIMKKV